MRTERDHINDLIDTADMGPPEDTSAISIKPTERHDLYDSDRTVILRKLSGQLSVDETDEKTNDDQTDVNQLSVEQMQRRMKAFALTKKMKRVQEQRNAMHGIMAIQKEKENREHFSLNETEDLELEQTENKS
jgi:hypothetical protein